MKKKIFSLFALTLTLLAVTSAKTLADSLGPITFENPTYNLGSINGQDGWSSTGSYDQAVVSSPVISGSQSFRISNAVTSGSFGDQTFSKSLVNEAGETSAQNSAFSGGSRQGHFEVQFDFKSTMTTQQPGLVISVSPDRGDGARMGYLRFEDQSDGIHVFFDDYKDAAPVGTLANPSLGCENEDDFIETDIATIDRTSAHSIKLSMDFVDGPDNDVVKAYVDGVLKHTGGSWEDYFRWCTESGGGVTNDATADVSRTVDSLLIRAGGTSVPANSGNGYLFDNLSLTSGPIVTPTPTLTPTPTPINAFAVPAQCDQNIAYNHIVGKNKAENINGTGGADLIEGMGGADNINGKGGADCIVTGSGASTVHGDNGDDVIIGGNAADRLYGDNGADKLYGNGGADTLDGGDGKDTLDGGAAADRAIGGSGQDTCIAESKNSCEL